MAQVSLSIAKSSRSPASPSAQPEIPLCSLCLCALCVKHNLPAAHVDATQGVPGKFSLNTEDTEAQRTQRNFDMSRSVRRRRIALRRRGQPWRRGVRHHERDDAVHRTRRARSVLLPRVGRCQLLCVRVLRSAAPVGRSAPADRASRLRRGGRRAGACAQHVRARRLRAAGGRRARPPSHERHRVAEQFVQLRP